MLWEPLGIALNQGSTNYSQLGNPSSACFGIAYDLRMVFTLLRIVTHTHRGMYDRNCMYSQKSAYLLSIPLQKIFTNPCFKQGNYCTNINCLHQWRIRTRHLCSVLPKTHCISNILSLPNSFSAYIPFRDYKNDFNYSVKSISLN